jgi:hypothetical protein
MIGVWFLQTSGADSPRIYQVVDERVGRVSVRFPDSDLNEWLSSYTDRDDVCCPTCDILWSARRVP